MCLLDHAYEAPFANMPLILRSGAQYGNHAMVTKLLIIRSYCGAHLVEFYYKE